MNKNNYRTNLKHIKVLTLLFNMSAAICHAQNVSPIIPLSIISEGSDLIKSKIYSVTVNNASIDVRNSNKASDIWFAFGGVAEIKIKVNSIVSTYKISPLSANINSTLTANTITFTISKPGKYIIHDINGVDEKLAIWAEALPYNFPAENDPNIVNIISLGADPTGKVDANNIIQNAINKIEASQILYVPKGNYKITNLKFKSNLKLFFEPGASLNMNAQTGVMIDAWGCNNMQMYGFGTLNCNGFKYPNGSDGNRKAMVIRNSGSNHIFKDFCIREPQHWAWISTTTDGGTIENIKVLTSVDGLNRDGIDPNDWKNLIMNDCFIVSGDDCMAINMTKSKTNVNMKITNSVFWNLDSGADIKLGPEWTSGTSGIHVENCDFIGAPRNISFLNTTECADILFKTIRCENAANNLLDVNNGATLSNVIFQDLKVNHTRPATLNNGKGKLILDGLYRTSTLATNNQTGNVVGSSSSIVEFKNTVLNQVKINSLNVFSSEDNSQKASFIIERVGNLHNELTVQMEIYGSATNGEDYDKINSVITFNAGQNKITSTITSINDQKKEGIETIRIRLLTNPSYSLTADWQVQLLIFEETLTNINTISVSDNQKNYGANNSCSIYPNPAQDVVTITNAQLGTEIKLLDLQGRELISQKATSENTELNLQALPQGLYLLKVGNVIQKLTVE